MMSNKDTRMPEWAPGGAGEAFASRVMKGVGAGSLAVSPHRKKFRRPVRDAAYHIDGVLAGDRAVLARAITLIESNLEEHMAISREILHALLPHGGGSIRIGVTGVPGAGKSTFIDALGYYLCESQGRQVAVLAVDPSSSVSGGSILGDKTRMEKLCRHPKAFIRPSPTGGSLGGVTRKSRETIVLCEAAGFDVVLVETVGVGQSEITVRSMVDFFLLVMIAGAGDELQGIKKGVIEIADALLVNKADGPNRQPARLACKEYTQALRYLAQATPNWKTEARLCSALTGEGIPEFWQLVQDFRDAMTETGFFAERRRQQRVDWTLAMAEQHLLDQFYGCGPVRESLEAIKHDVATGLLSTSAAAERLLALFRESREFRR